MNKVILIFGPTASEKSKTAIKLSQNIGEIINADSMQIYRGLDIGTAKIKKTERNNISHHLIDIKNPNENYSVYDFKQDSIKIITEIQKRNKIPFVVGGTALYFKALTEGLFQGPPKNDEIRNKLYKLASKKDLHNILEKIDKKAASKIHPSDQKRIIRALEVYEITKTPISNLWEKHKLNNIEKNYQFLKIGITMEREKLYNKINKRCQKMIENGLIEETKHLISQGYNKHFPSMKAIGYKHFLKYLSGEENYENTENYFKRDSRRFAKRQWTFFKSFPKVNWFKAEELNMIKNTITKFINDKQ